MARQLDKRRPESRDRVGLWVGLTTAFLISSLAMVQLRCKVTGGYPCGDWPLHGYTKEFWPSFLVALAAWGLAARLRAHRTRSVWAHALDEMGRASAPMLGLVLAWVWYGLTGDAFHPAGGCTIPVLCHDVMPSAIVVWAGPWVIWGSWRVVSLLKAADES